MGPLWLTTSAHSHCPSLSGLPALSLSQRSWDITSLPRPLPRAETWPLSPLASRMVATSCNSHQCHLICSQLHIGPLHTFHRRCRGNPPGIGTLHCPRCRPGIPRSQSTTVLAFLGTYRTCVRSSQGSRRTSGEQQERVGVSHLVQHRQGTALLWKLLYSFNYAIAIISDNA